MARCGPKREGSVWVRPVFAMSLFGRRLARPTPVCFSAVRRSVWIRCPPRDPFARCRGPVSESHLHPAVASRCSHSFIAPRCSQVRRSEPRAEARVRGGVRRAQTRAWTRGRQSEPQLCPKPGRPRFPRRARKGGCGGSPSLPTQSPFPRKAYCARPHKRGVWGSPPLPTQNRVTHPRKADCARPRKGGCGGLPHFPRKTIK